MYQSPRHLPHLLPPSAYWSADQHTEELAGLFLPTWHLVGSQRELSRPGDFLTVDLFGYAIQVRNFDGELRALSNVCAHRHCLLTSDRNGSSPTMRCQYHGWEYRPDGRTGHIPEPKNFVPFDREAHRLPAYRVDSCGQLVFVSLAQQGPSLEEHLGEHHDLLRDRFDDRWRECLAQNSVYRANWKVPVENSLEAYHVPSVHPSTFRDDPGEARTTHVLRDDATILTTQLPFASEHRRDVWIQRLQTLVTRGIGITPSSEYTHLHVFPNLLVSFTDLTSFCQSLLPLTATTAHAVVRQFGSQGTRRLPPAGWVAKLWGQGLAGVTTRILAEDARMFAAIQRGLECSPHRGTLGRAEERVHAFQRHIHTSMAGRAASPARPAEPARAESQP